MLGGLSVWRVREIIFLVLGSDPCGHLYHPGWLASVQCAFATFHVGFISSCSAVVVLTLLGIFYTVHTVSERLAIPTKTCLHMLAFIVL